MPFIGKQGSTGNSKIKKYSFTATASQTAFSVSSDASDELQVFLNGVLLKLTDDYTYTTSTVTLGSGASLNDIVEVHVYQSFLIADAVKGSGDTMNGELEVPTVKLSSNVIKASDGGSTITLDTSDNVTIAGGLTATGGITNAGTISAGTIGSSVTGFTGIKVLDNWRTTTNNTTTGGTTAINANLERVDDPAVTLIGSPMTHSSGVFAFPMTGIYLIGFQAQFYLNGTSRFIGTGIQSVISGTEDNLALSYTYMNNLQSDTTYTSCYCSAVIDVSDTTTHKIQFVYESSQNQTATMWGSTSYNATNFTFMRIGDT